MEGRFGGGDWAGSRSGSRSKEELSALLGVSWSDLSRRSGANDASWWKRRDSARVGVARWESTNRNNTTQSGCDLSGERPKEDKDETERRMDTKAGLLTLVDWVRQSVRTVGGLFGMWSRELCLGEEAIFVVTKGRRTLCVGRFKPRQRHAHFNERQWLNKIPASTSLSSWSLALQIQAYR